MNYNAALPWDEKYDVVICYNLLHELPLKTRQQVMDNALNSLTNGGKAIFVDYAEPELWHPLKWPLFLYNRLYHPFAESLWEKPLESFCMLKDEYRWHHTYYCGKLYQKTVAVRKILSSDDVVKLTKLFHAK
jgi:SAM-dependent methyltransferase